jgi:hypothetical protein
MRVDLTNFSPETVLPTPANAADPYWHDAARRLLMRVAADVQKQGGEWRDVRCRLSEGGKKLDAFFLGISEAERASVVSTALWGTRWRDLDAI